MEYINPFISGVDDLFNSMLGCQATRQQIGLSKESNSGHEIAAMIGLTGRIRGTVQMGFPSETALAMVDRLMNTAPKEIDKSVLDAMAEFVNIVAGSAKAKMCKDDEIPIDVSLPNVVRGDHYAIEYPSKTTWIEVSFTSPLGPFVLRVTFEECD